MAAMLRLVEPTQPEYLASELRSNFFSDEKNHPNPALHDVAKRNISLWAAIIGYFG
jgi:hypothetical protein